MKTTTIRVRFAPAPTGMMHLGNIRTALMNYLMARQKKGVFILRIEDTDAERNYDPGAVKIQEDLSWLSLIPNEGPQQGGAYGPYFQSERASIYQEKLQTLIDKGLAYRCFCTIEELEKKRQRQITLKQPPRYDRTCNKLTAEEAAQKAQSVPFIWRVRLDHSESVTITDLAHGKVTFEYKNFSDFPVTREDGSVTFIFANFVDDMLMNMTCVIRGEDHLSNTALQAALYRTFEHPFPLFWHMPILCNVDGKKLSKRDFGFSLRDLKEAGFLPEAIVNYLAIIGGSFKHEIMSLDQLVECFDFEHISTTGQVKYDVEKLRWVNHKWIAQLSTDELVARCLPYLVKVFPTVSTLDHTVLHMLFKKITSEMFTLADCVNLLAFYFTEPEFSQNHAYSLLQPDDREKIQKIIQKAINQPSKDAFLETVKIEIKQMKLSMKEVFQCIRYLLTGSEQGMSITDLIEILAYDIIKERTSRLK